MRLNKIKVDTLREEKASSLVFGGKYVLWIKRTYINLYSGAWQIYQQTLPLIA